MADDEFGDDSIDWTAVDLPHVSVSMVGRQHQGRGGCKNVYEAGNQPVNTTSTGVATAISGTSNRMQTTIPHSENNEEALRRQIEQLQDLLEAKNEQIFELEATAAASAVESTALVQRAESDARSRIHLIEEELRRVKREADQYKGQWVRVKKRVAELEAGRSGDDAVDECLSTRAITPSNADHNFHNNVGEDFSMVNREKSKSPGVKRKFQSDQVAEKCSTKNESYSFIMSPALSHNYDSVRQRVIKHVILRDDMGCYLLENNLTHLARSLEVNVQNNEVQSSKATSEANRERNQARSPLSEVKVRSKNSAQTKAIEVEQETVSFVKSILYHMMAGGLSPASEHTHNVDGAMSVSGLALVLLERFNSLFIECHTSRQREELMEIVDESFDTQDEGIVLLLHSDGNANAKATYATKSWKAVLYLLHVLQDIILLSGKTRNDLRLWFYKSRHSDGSRSLSDDQDIHAEKIRQESQVNTRIEGLPTPNPGQDLSTVDRKETLWSVCCRPVMNEDDGWDAMTMTLPCNIFYEIIVGLMKGHIYPSQANQCFSDAAKEIAQYAQNKSIDFVSHLMSDAAPYDHADLSCRSKTPYLWKFWFDSLFPKYSSRSGLAANSADTGDFFSLWETSGGNHRATLIGSGRRYHTQLPKRSAECDVQPTKLTGEKQSSKAKTITLSVELTELERLVIDTKSRILQLMSHFILSSSSIHQNIYKLPSSLAKRVLFCVLDEVDEFIIPCIRSRYIVNQHGEDFGRCLELCYSCVMFVLVLSRSDAGLYLLRIQARLDFFIGGRSRWSASGIACVTAILDNVLSYIAECEGEYTTTSHVPLMKRVVEQCIFFFKNLLSFVHSQHAGHDFKSQVPSLTALVAEEYNVFLSCCHRVLALKMFRDELKYETRLILEELLLEDEE